MRRHPAVVVNIFGLWLDTIEGQWEVPARQTPGVGVARSIYRCDDKRRGEFSKYVELIVRDLVRRAMRARARVAVGRPSGIMACTIPFGSAGTQGAGLPQLGKRYLGTADQFFAVLRRC